MAENINPKYKAAIIKAINYHFPDAKIILFGSRARGTNKEGADVDVAIDLGETADLGDMYRARVTLEHLPIAVEVDLVDLHMIPQELKAEILREGVMWKL